MRSSISSFGSHGPRSRAHISHQRTTLSRPLPSLYRLDSSSAPRSPRQPVSSATSRATASSNDSASSSFPFGKVQSSYFGRWTSSTPPLRRSTAPAACTSGCGEGGHLLLHVGGRDDVLVHAELLRLETDRKSTRLNSSHLVISYAVFCLKKKTTTPANTSTATSS